MCSLIRLLKNEHFGISFQSSTHKLAINPPSGRVYQLFPKRARGKDIAKSVYTLLQYFSKLNINFKEEK